METSRAVGILDGITGNLATDALRRLARPWSQHQSVKVAIRRTAGEYPYSDVSRCLFALVDEIPGESDRGKSESLVAFADRYLEIARVAGDVLEERDATDIVRRFVTHLDAQDLTLAEHDQRDRERADKQGTQLDQIASGVAELLVMGKHNAAMMAPPALVAVSQVDQELAAITALIDAGSVRTADERLAKLSPSELAEDLQFRVATLAGICKYQQGDGAAAITLFETARRLRPQHPAAASNLAAAYLGVHDPERALVEARDAWQLDPTCTANYIAALQLNGQEDQIAALIPDDLNLINDADTLLALSRVYFGNGQYANAERSARRAVEISDDADAKEALALALLGISGFSRMHASAGTLRYADRLLTDAIRERTTWQSRVDVARFLANRAVARTLGRDYENALHDVDQSLEENESSEARVLRARLLTALGRFSEAITEFESLADQSSRTDVRLAFAHCLVDAGRSTQALPLIEEAFATAENADEFIGAIHTAIDAAASLNDFTIAETYVARLPARTAPAWLVRAAEGYLLLKRGEVSQAIAVLETAAALAPPDDAKVIRANLARAYGRVGRWVAAVTAYRSFVTCESDIEFVQSLLVALFNAGRYVELVQIYDECIETKRATRTLRELRARVHEREGDLRSACALYLVSAKEADGTAEDYLHAAICAWRCQDGDLARELVSKIATADLSEEPELLMRLAEIYDGLGIDPLRIAYCAQALSHGAPDVPATYARIYHAWRDAEPTPSCVRPDVAVSLLVLTSSSITTIVVSSDPLDERARDHVRTTSAQGRALTGHRVGDILDLPFQGGVTRVEVTAVENKLDYAFRDAIENSRRRFGSAAQVGPVEEYIANVMDDPDRAALRAVRVQKRRRYHEQQVTIGAAADGARCALIRFFCWETFASDGAVHAFSGNAAEALRQATATRAGARVVMDLTSLITLARLELLEKVCEFIQDIAVTQWTIDSLLFTRAELFASNRAPFVGVYEGGVLTSKRVDEAHYRSERDVVDRCLAFVQTRATVEVVPAIVSMSRRELVRLVRKYGRLVTTSVLAAARPGSLLLCDDVLTQTLASADGATAVGTQVFLDVLQERRILSKEEYVAALAKLSALNYRFLRLSSRDLYVAWTGTVADESDSFTQLVPRLGDSDCDLQSVIHVGADLLRRVWTSGAADEQRQIATACVVLAPSLLRGYAAGQAIRDKFLTMMGRHWYESEEAFNVTFARAIEVIHYWLAHFEEAERRVSRKGR